jgi:hypothetical protein
MTMTTCAIGLEVLVDRKAPELVCVTGTGAELPPQPAIAIPATAKTKAVVRTLTMFTPLL